MKPADELMDDEASFAQNTFCTGRVLQRSLPILDMPSAIESEPPTNVRTSEVSISEMTVLPSNPDMATVAEESISDGVAHGIFHSLASLFVVTSGFAAVGVAVGLVLRFLISPADSGAHARAAMLANPREQISASAVVVHSPKHAATFESTTDDSESAVSTSAQADGVLATVGAPSGSSESASGTEELSVRHEMTASVARARGSRRDASHTLAHARHSKKGHGKKHGKSKRK